MEPYQWFLLGMMVAWTPGCWRWRSFFGDIALTKTARLNSPRVR